MPSPVNALTLYSICYQKISRTPLGRHPARVDLVEDDQLSTSSAPISSSTVLPRDLFVRAWVGLVDHVHSSRLDALLGVARKCVPTVAGGRGWKPRSRKRDARASPRRRAAWCVEVRRAGGGVPFDCAKRG